MNRQALSVLLAAAALVSACGTVPERDSTLSQARADYSAAQADPQVASLAPSELRHASDALDRANAAARNGDDRAHVDHLAYVAKQQVALARETARERTAERAVAAAGAERDRVRLEMRTREADVALRNAEAARQQAEASQRNAEAARLQSEAALRQTQESERNAEAARRQAAESERQAAAERKAAADAEANAQLARQQGQEAEARARMLEAQLKELEAKKTDRGMVITLGDVLFDTNQAHLKPGGMRAVQRLADFCRQYPQRAVMIEGFTDSTGTASRNQQLSEERAQAVRTSLIGMGVASDRIVARGYGPGYPVAGNDTAAGRQLNRRVEIIVSDESGKIAPR